MHIVSLGKVSVIWLLATMEALCLAKGSKEFVKSSRVGSKSLIAKRWLIKFGRFWFSRNMKVVIGGPL